VKRLAILGAWVVATALAVGIGIGAVQLAGAQVTDDAIQPLSADEVPTLPPSPDATPDDDSPAGSSVPPAATTTAAPETTVPAPTSSTTAADSAAPTTTATQGAPATTAAPSTSAPVTTAAETTSTTAPPTTTSTASGSQPEVTVHQLVGGSVAIETWPSVVNLVWATPNAGFTVDVEAAGPAEVEIDFTSGSHESKFRAKWSGGVLDIEKREGADD